MRQSGSFDLDERLAKLSKQGGLHKVLNTTIPGSRFRPILNKIQKRTCKSNSRGKPYDVIVMSKLLVLQSLYNLSDEQVEFQARDRLSYMRFLDLGLEDRIPDATTLWLFRESLIEHGLNGSLLDQFNCHLDDQGYEARKD